MGAVGLNHFVELLNGMIAVYDKCGTVITQTYTTNFFAVTNGGTNYPTGDTLDGRILYDLQSKRWIACALDGGSHQLMLSISKGDDPSNLAAGWTNYLVRWPGMGFRRTLRPWGWTSTASTFECCNTARTAATLGTLSWPSRNLKYTRDHSSPRRFF